MRESRLQPNLPAADRIARARQLADAMGPCSPDFDMKQFTDELWSDCQVPATETQTPIKN